MQSLGLGLGRQALRMPAVRGVVTRQSMRNLSLDTVRDKVDDVTSAAKTGYSKIADRVLNSDSALVYNLKVTRELAKQVYIGEKLAPPSFAEVKSYYEDLFEDVRSPDFWKKVVSQGDYLRWFVIALELCGIFTIGTVIGRLHLLGYKIDDSKLPHEHGH